MAGWQSTIDTFRNTVNDLISGAGDYIYEKHLGHPRGLYPEGVEQPYYLPTDTAPTQPVGGGPPAGYRGMEFGNIPMFYAAGAVVLILVVLLARRK